MTYLLDTDTVSAIAKERSASAEQRLQQVPAGSASISVITLGEVRFGLALSPVRARVQQRIDAMLLVLRTLALGPSVVPHYAGLRAHLQGKGAPIGANDLWLAAHALAENLTLVTGNEREFRRVPKLHVENWLR